MLQNSQNVVKLTCMRTQCEPCLPLSSEGLEKRLGTAEQDSVRFPRVW